MRSVGVVRPADLRRKQRALHPAVEPTIDSGVYCTALNLLLQRRLVVLFRVCGVMIFARKHVINVVVPLYIYPASPSYV